MNEDFIKRMRNKLLNTRVEVLHALAAENDDIRTVVEDITVKDLGDVAAYDLDIKMLDAIGSRDSQRLKKVEAALGRISAGRYGVCLKCKNTIPQRRLEAIPHASLCIKCQESSEK